MTDAVIQVLMSFITSAGFSVLFNVRGKNVVINGLGGALSWIVYLLVFGAFNSLFWGFFISTLAVALLCYMLAKTIKAPVTVMLVPMIIPLIPGGLLYNTVFNIITGNNSAAMSYFRDLVIELAGINLAIIAVATLFEIIYSVRKYRLGRV